MEPSKKVRAAIHGLKPEELDDEIDLGSKSRFSRAIPYMKKRQRIIAGKQRTKMRRWDLIKKLVVVLVGAGVTAFVTKLMGLY